MTLTETARCIHYHLCRLENDPEANLTMAHGGKRFYNAGARRAGRYVSVSYIRYQGWTNLTREEAEEYLSKLDAGYTGRHFQMRGQ